MSNDEIEIEILTKKRTQKGFESTWVNKNMTRVMKWGWPYRKQTKTN
jgi:hypothetical protein